MTVPALFEQIKKKRSYLCVGLDTDIDRIPAHLKSEPDPVFSFNKQIIDATAPYCVAYKPNIAFYESMGPRGWESLEKTLAYLGDDLFTIADAKRGDIGNTSALYARTFFEYLDFDAVTVAPYMGHDSVTPFLAYEGKWVILLAHTSNPGSQDFQTMKLADGRSLYEEVIARSRGWAGADRLMYVVGATHDDKIASIRALAPDHFFLVPGVGAQGGGLDVVSRQGMNAQCGLLVNSSRGILYASSGKDFAKAAAREAQKLQQEMDRYLQHL